MKWSSAKPTRKRIWSGLVLTEDHFTCLVCGLKYVSWADDNNAVWHTSNHTDMSSCWWKPPVYRLLLSNPWGPRGNPGLDWANPYRPGVDESRTADLVAKPTSFADIVFGFAHPWSQLLGGYSIIFFWFWGITGCGSASLKLCICMAASPSLEQGFSSWETSSSEWKNKLETSVCTDISWHPFKTKYVQFSKHWPSGPMLSISQNVHIFVCVFVCLCVCLCVHF